MNFAAPLAHARWSGTLLLLGLALAPGAAMAASGASVSAAGVATATVAMPITLIHTDDDPLDFGKFTAGSGGTVVVDATSGAGHTTADVSFVPGSSTMADSFRVIGEGGRMFSVTTGPGTVTHGSQSMSFTTVPSVTTGVIALVGHTYLTVGGTLTVNANQTPGGYQGSYPVTVNYC